MRLHALRCPVLALGLALALSAAAQADSLRAVMAAERATIARADSTGDRPAAFEARRHLATLAGQAEALVLLVQAAALADSLHRPDLGAMARRELARRHAAAGRYAAAYAESLRSDSLDRLREQRDAAAARERMAGEGLRAEARYDSLARLALDREQAMARTIGALRQKADRWMYITLAVLLAGLCIVAWLLYRTGTVSNRLRATIAELRRAVDAGALRPPPDPGREIPPASPPSPVDEAMKPVVEGLFQKAAPERLATLRDARRRGDTEKVLRVVASLKPQLLAFDAGRFGPLIARLRAPGAASRAEQWSADLDALEQAVQEWAEGKDGR